ncbi:2-oxo acid dehydrogenase subunit E2 [Roseibium sp. MMSF_3544]|uniref:2-oxo acid dehydrogenase subunit E2 n=1 Tax=unclassified Roseibium TaxID=2629323 RepID=UPI00273E3EDF|nr:2-oxo acid dehydrogenase subunit E2 [Roseibium sp. MMSF_3544]
MNYIASPSVRSYAGRLGVDLDAVAGVSGRKTLAKEDIDQYLSGGAGDGANVRPAASTRYWDVDHSEYGPVSDEPVSRMAKIAADNLASANAHIPQVTHHDRADIRKVEALRAGLKEEAVERGIKLTTLAFHVKTLAACLKANPKFNTSLSADLETLYQKSYIHIGVAVDTPAGLMVPVVRDADKKGLWQIAGDIADLAVRAQGRKIRPEEMGGASMSISNLGGIGGTAFTPIVNPPEVAILGITRTETVPVWENDAFVPVSMVPLDLSYDHRVINGADAARFLTHYCTLLKEPRRLLL